MSSKKKKNIDEYPYIQKDETAIKEDSELLGLGVAIEPKDRAIFSFDISKEHNMFVASERFLSHIKEYGKHPVSTDWGCIWYPQACKFLKLKYHLHNSFEKSLVERTMQYIKGRNESFDDYFPCRLDKCKLKHVKNWLNLFIHYHNKELGIVKGTEPISLKQPLNIYPTDKI